MTAWTQLADAMPNPKNPSFADMATEENARIDSLRMAYEANANSPAHWTIGQHFKNAQALLERNAFADCEGNERVKAAQICQINRLPDGELARNQAECMSMWAEGRKDDMVADGTQHGSTWKTSGEVSASASAKASGGFLGVVGAEAQLGGSVKAGGEFGGLTGDNHQSTQTVPGFAGYDRACAHKVGWSP